MNDPFGIRKSGQGYFPLFVTVFAVLAADQLTKLWICKFSGFEEGCYPPFGGIEIIPGFFSIVYATNTGAAWGIFSGHGFVLAAIGILALAAIYGFRRRLELEKRSMQIIFGLMSGGIAGNILDRFLIGRVTDFLDFYIGRWHWPTFNIADSSMVIAACLYLLIGMSGKKDSVTKKAAEADKK